MPLRFRTIVTLALVVMLEASRCHCDPKYRWEQKRALNVVTLEASRCHCDYVGPSPFPPASHVVMLEVSRYRCDDERKTRRS